MIEISPSAINLSYVKNPSSSSNSLIPVIGTAYVKKSVRNSASYRLVNIMNDGSSASYRYKNEIKDIDYSKDGKVQ